MFIHLKEVSYIYNFNMPFETEALNNINLRIDTGDFLGIIGHTGCGKTTLLQLLAGLLKPTKGQIYVNNIDIHKNKDMLKEVRKKIGLSFQYPEYQFFEESIFKEVAFGPKNMGITGDQLEYRIKNSLEMVNMDYSYYKDRTPFSLSGGEMRRVAIASILAMDPEIIILDEPTASLDPYNCSKILSVIKNLYEKYNRTIIIVSHSMEIIAELTNRIIVMEKGRVIMDDKPKSIFSDSAARLEESGLSLPPITSVMNKLKKYKKTVSSAILSIDEATDEICKMIKKNKNEFF